MYCHVVLSRLIASFSVKNALSGSRLGMLATSVTHVDPALKRNAALFAPLQRKIAKNDRKIRNNDMTSFRVPAKTN